VAPNSAAVHCHIQSRIYIKHSRGSQLRRFEPAADPALPVGGKMSAGEAGATKFSEQAPLAS
jgi:hypothetical protein